ncbi:MAG: hypothetical protein WBQ00_15025 [Terriglobales bacterium]
MRLIHATLAFVLMANWTLQAEQQKWVSLPPSQSESLARLCSRNGPKVDGGWKLTKTDVDAVEKALADASYLRERLAHSTARSSDPQSYYRQHIGVTVAGRKVIYINGICREPPSYWKKELVDVCDGGCDWGVLYDPATGEFSQFTINGVA